MPAFEVLLRSFLNRRLTPREAVRELGQFAVVNLDSNPAYIRYRDHCPGQVELTPNAVRQALQAFVDGSMAASDLRDWALFVTLSGAFSTPTPPAEDGDWFDPMWDAVHDLACPVVHGPITTESVATYVARLGRYGDDPN